MEKQMFVKITLDYDDGESAGTTSMTFWDDEGKFPGMVRTLVGFLECYDYAEEVLKELQKKT